VEGLASDILSSFGKVKKFGTGGMLQATLGIEFIVQTLTQYVTPTTDTVLKSIYRTISPSYIRQSGAAGELQRELESLKKTLSESRKATMLQFLAFRKYKERVPGLGGGTLKEGTAEEKQRGGGGRRGGVAVAPHEGTEQKARPGGRRGGVVS